MIEKQELHCHACSKYVQFEIDLELNGNHILSCPNCGHEHCRVVKEGKITDIRWDSRNGDVFQISSLLTTYSTVSTFDTFSGSTTGSTTGSGSGTNYANNGSPFLYTAWSNTTTTT